MATSELFEHPLSNELIAYQRMRDDLEHDFYGRWVIIHGEELVGEDYDSYAEAEAAVQSMGMDVLTCFIRQVGVDSAIFLSHGK